MFLDRQNQSPASDCIASKKTNTSKGNILIVDDTPESLRMLSTILTQHGYEVRKAINGEMAVKSVQKTLPELILLDIIMPVMDGYEVCSVLKSSPETAHIPIIFLSAIDDSQDKVKAFTLGGSDYITKPFHLLEVLARIENQLTICRLQTKLKEKTTKLEEQNSRLQQEIYERHQTEIKLKQANRELQRLAHLDGLTKIANRRLFDLKLKQEWKRLRREQRCLSLILCDVDYFKSYNDRYGHQAGDDCLKAIAQTMNKAIKRPADLLARYGGEEFAIILPNTSSQGAYQLASQIQVAIRELKLAHPQSSVSSCITLSAGISSLIPQVQTTEPDRLIQEADKALYAAKERGRNCIVVKSSC